MNKKMVRRGGLALSAAVIAVVGLGVGSAAAGVSLPLLAPFGVSAADGAKSVPMPAPEYSTNASGETFGSAADARTSDEEPDLIGVVTTNDLLPEEISGMKVEDAARVSTGAGKPGYVRKSELDAANGSHVSSPAEAEKWMLDGAQKDHVVTVYLSDGKTPIGQFVVYGVPNQAVPK